MPRYQPAHIGFLLAALLAACAYLFFVCTPDHDLNALWLLSGETVRYGDGTSIRRNSLLLHVRVAQCIAIPVFAPSVAALAFLVDVSRLAHSLAQYAAFLGVLHLLAYASIAAFHALPLLLLVTFVLVTAQLFVAYRLRALVVSALANVQPPAYRCALAALDMLIAWVVYLLLAVASAFALSVQGVGIHAEPGPEGGGALNAVVVADGAAALSARSTTAVMFTAYWFYVVVLWLFVNGSAAHVVNAVVCCALLGNTAVPSVQFFALLFDLCLVVPTAANNMHQQYTLLLVRKLPPEVWLDLYNNGIFSDASAQDAAPAVLPVHTAGTVLLQEPPSGHPAQLHGYPPMLPSTQQAPLAGAYHPPQAPSVTLHPAAPQQGMAWTVGGARPRPQQPQAARHPTPGSQSLFPEFHVVNNIYY